MLNVSFIIIILTMLFAAGTLATQEVLRGVGVGSTEATPLAATITWVVKDSCGHLGKILFAFSHGYVPVVLNIGVII